MMSNLRKWVSKSPKFPAIIIVISLRFFCTLKLENSIDWIDKQFDHKNVKQFFKCFFSRESKFLICYFTEYCTQTGANRNDWLLLATQHVNFWISFLVRKKQITHERVVDGQKLKNEQSSKNKTDRFRGQTIKSAVHISVDCSILIVSFYAS